MKEKRLLIFNPEHDLALANGDPHFMPPASATAFANDCAWLPIWLYGKGLLLCQEKEVPEPFARLCQLLNLNPTLITSTELAETSITQVLPWGWNPLLRQQLLTCGVSADILPTTTDLENIKMLSHREKAREAMLWIHKNSAKPETLPQAAVALQSVNEATEFLLQNPEAVFKAPLSGSGRGVRWGREKLDTHLSGWIQNVIKKQGAVYAEKRMMVIQNFAAEFNCQKEVTFAGYSLFKTKNAVYEGNFLLSDIQIENHLAQWISINELHHYLYCLKDFLTKHFLGKYYGFLGVDMFVYQENDNFRINPVVEINTRTTMGCLARLFYDKFVSPSSHGFLSVCYLPQQKNSHHNLQNFSDLEIENGKIKNGTISLSPMYKNSSYQVIVNVKKE